MCSIFKVSRSGYYTWLERKPSKYKKENELLIKEIRRIYNQSKQTYGSPRITQELKSLNIRVSRPRVARLMKKENIQSQIRKKYVVTTDSKHSYKVAPNLLNRNFQADHPGQTWVSDITYIRTTQGWLYLTIVMDLYDRKIIGWALSPSLDTSHTSIPALKMALQSRMKDPKLIFHSDRGVQYACDLFKQLLFDKKIEQSMSRKGNCWDNAVAESFFKSLKSECIYRNKLKNMEQTKMDVFWYIEVWYNRKRKHSALNYMTPAEMENLINNNLAA